MDHKLVFFYLPKKLTVLDILEGNDATSILMGMSSAMITYLLRWFVDSHYF